jgi:hypothetical protein
MKEQAAQTRSCLRILVGRIERGDYPHDCSEWSGADVVITPRMPNCSKDEFYPAPRCVVTRFSRELSWLFEEMRDVFASFLDGCNKIEFYGRLANMVARYQHRIGGSEENQRDLLLAVMHEAFSMLEEMEEGRFQCLPVAIGNTILDDAIKHAESGGYLGIDETRKFFEDMERRYRHA